MQLSDEERRALVVIAALIVLASGARWIERPRPLLEDVAALDLDSLQQASTAAKPPPRGADASPGDPIDPNRAPLAELMRLPGVGEAMAQRIVQEREKAPFTSVADMRRVRGIGEATARRLAPLVTLPELGPVEAGGEVKKGTSRARPSSSQTRPSVEAAPRPERTRESVPDGPIILNSASAAELERIRGIGVVLAARLVQRRDSIGGFDSWDDVDAVPGVGPALLAQLKESAVLR